MSILLLHNKNSLHDDDLCFVKKGRKEVTLFPSSFPFFFLSLSLNERRRRNGMKKEGGDENNAELGRTCNNRLTGKKEESSFIERERERVLEGREKTF